MTLIANHAERALSRLLEQYKDKPVMAAMLTRFVEQAQLIENMWNEMLVERYLTASEGAQLDLYGRVAGEPRNGRTDEQYRPRLQARQRVNRSRGQILDALAVGRTLVGSTGAVTLRELYPAGAEIFLGTTLTSEEAQEVGDMLREAKPAGVELNVTYRGDGLRFRFGGSP